MSNIGNNNRRRDHRETGSAPPYFGNAFNFGNTQWLTNVGGTLEETQESTDVRRTLGDIGEITNYRSVLELTGSSVGDAQDENELGPYEIYVLSEDFRNGLGIALVDTGAQVSLVKYEDLKRGCSLKGDKTRIMGITGDSIEVRGVLHMRINESEEFPFMVVEKLPRNAC